MTSDLVGDLLLVFAVIFSFEIVDRTNFAVVTLSTRHPHQNVWVGAAGAFLVSTTISVAVGWLIVSYLLAYLEWVRVAGGLVLLLFGARTLLERWPGREAEKAETVPEALTPAQVVAAAFSLVLLLEMGDNTQILTILFVTQMPLLIVFVAAWAALLSVSAIGAFTGRFLKDRVPAERLERVLGGVLVVVGAVTIAWALGWLPIPFF
jgi:Ca2+/H+ antiporter, TMEM165/GDT1 family